MDKERVLPRITEDLRAKYDQLFTAEEVTDIVRSCYSRLDAQSTVKTHLFTTTEHFADEQLHAMAVSRGLIEATKPRVLFVCPSNTGRSQIAAALMARTTDGAVATRSGGINPGGHLHHRAVEVLNERGIDLSAMYPKPIAEDVHEAAEVVVAMGCLDQIEQRENTRYIEWDVPLLANKSTEEVREIVALIESLVVELAQELTAKKQHQAA